MSGDKQKLLNVMKSLDNDYKAGKISPAKYKYFKAKYQEKLNQMDKFEATNRIRSMQGKHAPNSNKRKNIRKRKVDKNKEKDDLVQKYIINPKKDDTAFNKKNKKSKDSSTYKLTVVLVLIIAFTIGIAMGIFAFDFDDMSIVNADALVEDTSFPDTSNVTLSSTTNSTTNTTYTVQDTYEDTYESESDYNYESNGGSYESNSNQGGGDYSTGESNGGSEQAYTSP